MSPIDPTHAGAVNFLTERLVEALAGRAIIQVQNPIGLGSHSSRISVYCDSGMTGIAAKLRSPKMCYWLSTSLIHHCTTT